MKLIDQKITDSILAHVQEPDLALNALLHWRWSQLERMRRNIIRQAFKDLAISNTEEYSILVFISHMDMPGASDITAYLTMEKSTVSEFIKRCMARNLLVEEQRNLDKRRRFYRLTELGFKVLYQAHERMESINNQIFNFISEQEKQDLLQILVKLKNVEKALES